MKKKCIFIKIPEVIAEIKYYMKKYPRISPRKKNTTIKSPLIKHCTKIIKLNHNTNQ